MEIKFVNYTYNDNVIDLEILNHTITGITGNTKQELFDLLSLKKQGKGQLTIDNIKITKENISNYKKKISVVKKELDTMNFILTVRDLMNYTIRVYNLTIKDCEKKIKDSFIFKMRKPNYEWTPKKDLSHSHYRLDQRNGLWKMKLW